MGLTSQILAERILRPVARSAIAGVARLGLELDDARLDEWSEEEPLNAVEPDRVAARSGPSRTERNHRMPLPSPGEMGATLPTGVTAPVEAGSRREEAVAPDRAVPSPVKPSPTPVPDDASPRTPMTTPIKVRPPARPAITMPLARPAAVGQRGAAPLTPADRPVPVRDAALWVGEADEDDQIPPVTPATAAIVPPPPQIRPAGHAPSNANGRTASSLMLRAPATNSMRPPASAHAPPPVAREQADARTQEGHGPPAAGGSAPVSSQNAPSLAPMAAAPLPPGWLPVRPAASSPSVAPAPGALSAIPTSGQPPSVPETAVTPSLLARLSRIEDALAPVLDQAGSLAEDQTAPPSDDDGDPSSVHARPQVQNTFNVSIAMDGPTAGVADGREALADALVAILRDGARRQGLDL